MQAHHPLTDNPAPAVSPSADETTPVLWLSTAEPADRPATDHLRAADLVPIRLPFGSPLDCGDDPTLAVEGSSEEEEGEAMDDVVIHEEQREAKVKVAAELEGADSKQGRAPPPDQADSAAVMKGEEDIVDLSLTSDDEEKEG